MYDKRELTQKGGGDTEVCPFDLFITTTESGDPAVKVWPGTLGGVVISNYNQPLEITSTGVYFVIIRGTTTGYKITAAEAYVDSDPPDPQEPTLDKAPTTVDILIGVVVDNVVYKTWSCTNMIGVPVVAYHTNKASPVEAGSSPFNYYYVWDL